MPILTSVEERQKKERLEERKQMLIKFLGDLISSFRIWMMIGAVITVVLILIYLLLTFIFKWDLLYETNLDFKAIFFSVFISFVIAIIVCWLVAFFLYNTKHRRNIKKYKVQDIGRGGMTND